MFSSPFLVPFCVKYDKCCPANVPIPRCPIHTTNTLRNSATARNFNTPCLFQTAKAQNWPPNGATPFNQWATLGWVWFEDTTSHELMQCAFVWSFEKIFEFFAFYFYHLRCHLLQLNESLNNFLEPLNCLVSLHSEFRRVFSLIKFCFEPVCFKLD